MNSLLRGRLFATTVGQVSQKYYCRPLVPIISNKPDKNPSLLLMTQPLLTMNPTVPTDVALPSVLAANEAILNAIHHAGLPWWMTIVGATIALRTSMTLPIAIYQQRSMSRMIELAPMVQSWAETLKVSVARESRELGYDNYQKELKKQYRKKVNYLYAHHGCARWKVFLLPWVQMPLFVSMSLTLRHMSGMPLPWYGQLAEGPVDGLSDGGLSWFVDLTVPDPTWVLPVLIGAGNLLNVELNAWFARGQATRTQKIMTNVLRCVSVAFVPIAANVPMAIGIYWFSSSWYSVIQNLTFRIPSVRRKLGFPILQNKK